MLKAATWSDYKHHTAKVLVAISPNGAFTFSSKAWGGRTSDVHTTQQSGFYDILEPYDEVKKTKKVANLRIYVEQAIRHLKTFHLIKHELPIALIDKLDYIVTVRAAICNLYKPLCR